MAQVVIYGNGSIAALAFYELTKNSPHHVHAFTVDREYCTASKLLDRPVVPFDELAARYGPGDFSLFVAVGYVQMNRLRAERCAEARALGYELISHVSPLAVTWTDVAVGENTFISPNAVINPSAAIGKNVFVGAGCVIAHDCVVGDHCFFSDAVTLAGRVSVGPYCYLGTGATVRNHVTIGPECVIGAGAVLLADATERSVFMGAASEQLPVTSDKLNLA